MGVGVGEDIGVGVGIGSFFTSFRSPILKKIVAATKRHMMPKIAIAPKVKKPLIILFIISSFGNLHKLMRKYVS